MPRSGNARGLSGATRRGCAIYARTSPAVVWGATWGASEPGFDGSTGVDTEVRAISGTAIR
jgi:hypothetical protein